MCTSCGAPGSAHAVLDEDGSHIWCSLCLLALIGTSDRQAVALTVMVTASAPTDSAY